MSQVKWNPALLIPRFSNLVDGFFNDVDFFSPKNDSSYFPATNIEETDSDFILKMAVPGLNKEDVNVETDKNLLIISAEKETSDEEESKNYQRKEYSFTSFTRSFLLPENVLTDGIEAAYKDGELIIEIPKSEIEISRPKSITVS